ncbi:MAG: hypothetical protein HYX73_10795 [Acidobacteria bacterium]|nr:hypothetical protein [Acidobacteriota bacterium]
MPECRDNRSLSRSRHRAQSLVSMLALLILLQAIAGFSQSAPKATADSPNELTLDQFRSLVSARFSQTSRVTNKSRDPQPSQDLRPADEVFFQLLMIQAKDAAAHQSLDRLSGWSKSIQSRFQTQNAPELDVDVARFEEARMSADSARIEAEQKRIIERANRLLGRPATSPLVALLPTSDGEESGGLEKQQKDVLTQGEELVTRMYKSYQFGGISLTSLMAYEKVLYEFELEYRQALARNAMKPSSELLTE